MIREDGRRGLRRARCATCTRRREAGLRRAVVSSSANMPRGAAGRRASTDLFEARVDGIVAEREHLRGKPAPDTFLAGAQAARRRARRGRGVRGRARRRRGRPRRRLRLVVGVDRVGQADALREHGADVVVEDLAELLEQPMIAAPALRGRAVGRLRETELDLDVLARPSRCSRCRTATSACAATSTRASRTALPGTYLNSFYETAAAAVRRGRLRLPGVRPDGRQRHQRQDHPAARRRRAVRRALRRAARSTSACSTCAPASCAATSSGCRPPGQRGAGPRRRGWSRSPSAPIAAIRYEVEPLDEPRADRRCSPSWSPTSRCRRLSGDPRAAAALRDAAASRGAPATRDLRRDARAPHQAQRAARWRPAMDHVVDGPPATGRRRSREPRRPRPGHGRDRARARAALRLVKFLAYGWSSQRSLPGAARPGRSAALAGARAHRLGRAAARRSASTSTSSGSAPTSRSTATPSSSRRCASRCSTSCRPARAPSSGRSRPRA